MLNNSTLAFLTQKWMPTMIVGLFYYTAQWFEYMSCLHTTHFHFTSYIQKQSVVKLAKFKHRFRFMLLFWHWIGATSGT